MTRRLHELVTVTIGALGVPETSIGIVPVTLDLDGMNDQEIGKALADGYRAARRGGPGVRPEAVGRVGLDARPHRHR